MEPLFATVGRST